MSLVGGAAEGGVGKRREPWVGGARGGGEQKGWVGGKLQVGGRRPAGVSNLG